MKRKVPINETGDVDDPSYWSLIDIPGWKPASDYQKELKEEKEKEEKELKKKEKEQSALDKSQN